MTTLDWKFRDVMQHFRQDGRLAVYLCYLLHTNIRNRAWPSIETLMRETGWGRAAVVAAKDWLIEIKALETVSYDQRVDGEKALHQRREIMQVTGIGIFGGDAIPLLYVNSSVAESLVAESSATEPEVNTSAVEVQSSKDSALKRRKRPQDLIFNAIAKGSFNLTDIANLNGTAPRVAKAKKAFLSVKADATVEDIEGFYRWFSGAYPKIHAPMDADKIQMHFANYLQDRSAQHQTEAQQAAALDERRGMFERQE